MAKANSPEDLGTVQKALDQTISKLIPFDIQFRALKPNGETIHLIAKAKAQKDHEGHVTKIIGSNWDITELKHTRLKLERSKESFTETFQNSASGMAMVSPEGKWLKANEKLCQSLGYSEEELLVKTVQELTHPEDLKISQENINKASKGELDSYQLTKRYFHKDGSIVHAIISVTIVKKLNGDLSHSIAQVLDITSRIEAEKKLKSLVEVTKEQNESLLNFAHIVSHNLRSHSTNMTMLTKFLAQEKEEEERQNLVGMLIDASDGLSETIYHLNEVVQAKTGALEKMQSVNLLKTLESIEKNIEVLLLEKNVIPIVDVAPTHFVMGVPAYIESIFFNLYTNALKYSSPNRKLEIKIKSQAVDNFLKVSFADNGLGIDLERFGDKIFGMYKTFHENKDAKGIGLFITKNQVVSMGGTVEVESSPDKGATFIITLKKA
ncbi:PAS domain S-box protein [Maribacter litopenaei]|uniref:histidine kinase n=1 Tax=Maribacter litopenaei TaxID=2976127 RepID=A0ABY5Y9Y7_9FLAO|nr:sensor histidine kinase [Maribacter litopenaei]UWX54766.1 PAS domain S-box protein [Maribacter litopenaei]